MSESNQRLLKARLPHSKASGFPHFLLIGALALACGLPANAHAKGRRATDPGTVLAAKQVGKASWYGPGFHGKKTASGTIFNQNRLTAAHRRLPLGTKARVTNLSNGKAVEVIINDRGPYRGGRIIDLSYAAAQRLAINGVGQVRIETLP